VRTSFSFVVETDNLESTCDVDLARDSVLSWIRSVRVFENTQGSVEIEIIVVSGEKSEHLDTLLEPLHEEFPGEVREKVDPSLNYYGKKMAGALLAKRLRSVRRFRCYLLQSVVF
jgi:hypothetical protein